MRQSIAIAALASATLIAADASAQSRYGPRPAPPQAERPVADLPPAALLSWKGKPQVAPERQAAEEQVVQRPDPVAPWAQRMASVTPSAPRPLPEPASAASIPPPQPPRPAPPPASLPTSLYDPPAATQQPPPAPPPSRPPRPQPQTALLGEPRITGGAPSPVDPARLPPPNPGPRFYSVFREYGVTPDSIPVGPGLGRADEVQLKDVPSTPTLTSPDDTQYLPPRTNQSEAAASRTF